VIEGVHFRPDITLPSLGRSSVARAAPAINAARHGSCSHHPYGTVWATFLALTIAAACDISSRDTPRPMVTVLDSVVLRETDSVFVGKPTSIVSAADRTFLIADDQGGFIHHYAPDGQHLRLIGRRGRGPSEFRVGPGRLVILNDMILGYS